MTATVTQGGSPAADGSLVTFHPTGGLIADHIYDAMAVQPSGLGYWLAAANGAVHNYGAAGALGGISTDPFFDPVVDIVPTSTGNGYWLVTAGGEVTPKGDATGSADLSQSALNAPVVSMAADPNGGFWLLTSNGDVFAFGTAAFHGSASGHLPAGSFATSIVSTSDGGGYWIVGSNGTVVALGDATAHNIPSFADVGNDQVVRAAGISGDTGLFALTLDGKVLFTGSGASALGNLPDSNLPDSGFAVTPSGNGYWAMGADGQVFTKNTSNEGGPFAVPTHNGVATLGVSGIVPGITTMSADSLGGVSGTLDTRWSFPPGYWMVAKDGGIFTYGVSHFFGSEGGKHLDSPIVGMASTVDGGGYWLVASDGGVFSFGDATFFGSEGGKHLNSPIVGITPTADGGGYWLVAADGGVFSFGDATFFGSTGNLHLDKPVVGIASTSDGGGYWLVASDGGIFAYGDAGFFGSMGGKPLVKPVVGIASTPDDGGYWLAATDGGIFSFGDAPYRGSMGGKPLAKPVVGISGTPDGSGYWLAATDGGIFSFGDAGFAGSAGNLPLVQPVVGVASDPGFITEIEVLSRSTGGSSYRLPVSQSPEYRFGRWVEEHR